MADSVTLTTIRDECKQRVEMENSDFISDSEWNTYINQSVHELYDLILSAFGDDYFYSSTDLSTSAGNPLVALPASFYKLLGFDFVESSTKIATMERMEWGERDSYEYAESYSVASPPKYILQASNVRLYPTPAGVYTIRCHYVPVAPTLDAGGLITLNSVSGWHEYVVLDVCIKARIKEESSTRELMEQKMAMRERIQRMAPRRDQSEPFRVRRMKRYRKAKARNWFGR